MDAYEQLTTPDNLIQRIEALEAQLRSLQLRNTEAVDLSELTDDAGVIRGGQIIVGDGDPLATDGGFTGVALLNPGIDPTGGGTTYELVGMNAGVLEIGIDNLGRLLAGAGAVTIDRNGVSLGLPIGGALVNNNIKWIYPGTGFPQVVISAVAGTAIQTEYSSVATAAKPQASVTVRARGSGYVQNAMLDLVADDSVSFSKATITAITIDLVGTNVKANGNTILTGANSTGILTGTGNSATVPASSTTYAGFGYIGLVSATASLLGPTPAMNITAVYLRTLTAQPASGSLTIYLEEFGGAILFTCVIPAGGAATNRAFTNNSALLAAGSNIRLRLVNAATAVSAQIAQFSLTFSPGV